MPDRFATPPSGIPAAGKVLLVDDEPGVRRALTRLLRAGGLAAESFGSAQDLLAAIRPEPGPCCVVADLRMPGLSGLDLQEELRRRSIDIPIVFISGHADVGSGIKAMKGGAVDFLEKPVSEPALREAIHNALSRDRRRRADQVARAKLEEGARRLTPRESEVFTLIVTGLLNKEVGAELGASEKTIKVHRARVMEKMQAGSLAELVRMAVQLGPTFTSPRKDAREASART